MEVNRLLSDELSYELQIRGYPVGSSVEEKRTALRHALREEREGRNTAPTSTLLSVEAELSLCNSKLLYLEDEINTFNHDNGKNEFSRLYSRLRHVTLRLGRIHPSNESQGCQLTNLLMKAHDLMDKLNAAFYRQGEVVHTSVKEGIVSCNQLRQTDTISILDSPNPLIPEVVHSHSSVQPSRTDEPHSHDILIPDLDDPPKVVSQEPATHLPQPEIRDHFPFMPASFPCQASMVEQVQSSPQYGTNAQTTSQHLPAVHKNLQRGSTHSGVRFADDGSACNFSEHWSRMPNQELQSTRNETLPSRESTSLESKFNQLRFSAAESDVTSYQGFKYLDLGRWNLKYDGISSVNNFLDRAEELRKSRGVSKAQMLQSSAELFTKDALLWYRTNEFSSWDDLIFKLRDTFQPFDYEEGIWEELRRRTQGAQERVVIFIASMEQLFNRLREKPSEEARVRIIRRNLLPYIQTQLSLRTFTTTCELIQVCKAIEETEVRVQRFCPPPTNYRQLLEPQLAYHKPIGQSSFIASLREDREDVQHCSEPITSLAEVSLDSSKLTCWNCQGTGHHFKQCDKPRRLFCYKCGHENVTVTRCPKCTKNSKLSRQ